MPKEASSSSSGDAARGIGVGAPEVVETHLSLLFLTADRVFKLRKPVRFGFVDFSSREAREADCHREVALNRRYAPDVYLGVYDVSEGGVAIDHLVVMRRLPASEQLANLVATRGVMPSEIEAIVRAVLDADRKASRSTSIETEARLPALLAAWTTNATELRPYLGAVLEHEVDERIQRLAEEYLSGRVRLLETRIEQGRIRDGHGDLRAEDIYCTAGGPQILDCIEFDDRLRYGDVLADLAFLVMDLEHLGAPELSSQLLAAYEKCSGDRFPRSLVWQYCASRAYVRAKVACLGYDEGLPGAAEEASSYHHLALSFLERAQPKLVLVGGLPGSGKSTLARAMAARVGFAVIRSDAVRRELAEARPLGRSDRYGEQMTRATYRELLSRARTLLEQGEQVVLDASWNDQAMREEARSLAAVTRSALVELRCDAPREVTEARIVARLNEGADLSEATVAVARSMARKSDEWTESVAIDTSGTVARSLESALGVLGGRVEQ